MRRVNVFLSYLFYGSKSKVAAQGNHACNVCKISNIFEYSLPYSSDIEKMGIHKAPVDVFAKTKQANYAYRQLWEEVSKME
ncbi:MAG: hypothetical protein E6Q62_08470 [Nitrosomonas sp.]|nr:MAG: hypothetical protein E6Q62_08470 [Nitrosomonas sp.]